LEADRTSIVVCSAYTHDLGQRRMGISSKNRKAKASRIDKREAFDGDLGTRRFGQCPLYPRKQTSPNTVVMSALCQKQTHALQQFWFYSVGQRPQLYRSVIRIFARGRSAGDRRA